MGLECAFEGMGPRGDFFDRSNDPRGGRIDHLEDQMSNVTNRLDEISSMLLRLVPAQQQTGSSHGQRLPQQIGAADGGRTGMAPTTQNLEYR
jgi:hypothetical protein